MPGTTEAQEIELIIEKKGGGGGGGLPPVGGKGGGGDDSKKRPNRPNSPARYYTGIAIGIISVLMFFMALASAFLVRKGGPDWIPVHIPWLLWVNTAVLIASSGTLELARKKLAQADVLGFRRFWMITTILGVLFLIGQIWCGRAFIWRVIPRAVSSIFSLEHTGCICWVEWAH
jgi:cytochrome c oxidase subunit III